ncbi:Uncharacterised protein [Mycobacteroides abscessus subsp. abscessus]|nr:Uncharacterised protein [Mycobacteroides abscessus subsp. abscessus]
MYEGARRSRRHRRCWPFGVLRRRIAAQTHRFRRPRGHARNAAHPLGFSSIRGSAGSPQDQVGQRGIREDSRAPAFPILRKHRGGSEDYRRGTGVALRRRDLRGRRPIRQAPGHPGRPIVRMHRGRRRGGLVQREPHLPEGVGGPVRRAGRGCRQWQCGTGRGAHPRYGSKITAYHRHRRSCTGFLGPQCDP